MVSLAGKVAIVTGAGSGIGRAIARRFAADGARVAIAELIPERAESAAAETPGSKAYLVDVSSGAQVRAMVDQVVADLGQVDILVNCAGHARHIPTVEMNDDDWNEGIALLQSSIFYCSQAAGRHMVKQRSGCIINLASSNSVTALPHRLTYSTAKAAVAAMTRLLAVEWARYGVQVNALSPGMTMTPLVEESFRRGYADRNSYLKRIPMGRFATPEEVAEACYFLTTAGAAYMTGHNLIIDGGWSPYTWLDIDHEAQMNEQ